MIDQSRLAQEKSFNKYEERGAYHWDWYATNKAQYKDKIHLVLAHLPTTGTVVDIGGGDGLLSYRLFTNGLDVTCIDNNALSITLGEQMVAEQIYGSGIQAYIRKLLSKRNIKATNLSKRFERGDINFIAKSFDDFEVLEPFDYAVCHEVIEHVPDPKRLLQWMIENIKHYAIISTPDVTNHAPHKLDYNSWTPETFSQFLSPYRFEFILRDGWNMYVKLYK